MFNDMPEFHTLLTGYVKIQMEMSVQTKALFVMMMPFMVVQIRLQQIMI